MGKQERNRLLLIIALVLLGANLIMLSADYFKSKTVHKRIKTEQFQKKNKPNFEERIKSELGLSDDQLKKYIELKSEHMQKINVVMDSIRNCKWLIHNELGKKDPNINFINQLSDSIGKLNAEFEKMNYQHFYKLSEELTPDQFENYKKLLDNLSKGRYRNNRKHDDKNSDRRQGWR